MKRYLINLDGVPGVYQTEMRIYAEDNEQAARIAGVSDRGRVREMADSEHEHLIFAEAILRSAITSVVEYERSAGSRMTVLRFCVKTPFGNCEIKLYRDPEDGHIYDLAEWRLHRRHAVTLPVCWDIGSVTELFNTFDLGGFSYEVVSRGSKVCKPRCLKGVSPRASVRGCQVFTTPGGDVYVKHNDYFSLEVRPAGCVGTPLNYRLQKLGRAPKKDKFVYADSWGAIICRRQAWIKISGGAFLLRLNAVEASKQISSMQKAYHGFSTLSPEWERFWEDVIKAIK